MTSTEPAAEPVTAVRTLEKLTRLSQARVSATSPRNRVRVTLTGGKYSVELRPEGFQDLDPRLLADEVVHAVNGTTRGFREHEQQVLSQYRQVRRVEPKPIGETERKRLRQAQSKVSVKAESPTRMVRGDWSATDGLRLKIAAVNESHRHRLAEEIAAVVNVLSERFRTELREVTRRVREESRTQSR